MEKNKFYPFKNQQEIDEYLRRLDHLPSTSYTSMGNVAKLDYRHIGKTTEQIDDEFDGIYYESPNKNSKRRSK